MVAICTCFETLWLGGGSHTCVTPDFCTAHAKTHEEEQVSIGHSHLTICGLVRHCRSAGGGSDMKSCSRGQHGATITSDAHRNVWDLLHQLLVPPPLVTAVPAKSCKAKRRCDCRALASRIQLKLLQEGSKVPQPGPCSLAFISSCIRLTLSALYSERNWHQWMDEAQ